MISDQDIKPRLHVLMYRSRDGTTSKLMCATLGCNYRISSMLEYKIINKTLRNQREHVILAVNIISIFSREHRLMSQCYDCWWKLPSNSQIKVQELIDAAKDSQSDTISVSSLSITLQFAGCYLNYLISMVCTLHRVLYAGRHCYWLGTSR